MKPGDKVRFIGDINEYGYYLEIEYGEIGIIKEPHVLYHECYIVDFKNNPGACVIEEDLKLLEE